MRAACGLAQSRILSSVHRDLFRSRLAASVRRGLPPSRLTASVRRYLRRSRLAASVRRGLASLFILACACANDLEKQSEVVKLRVLAVRADPADLVVSRGQAPPRTTFTALAVDPSGVPISMRFALCTDQSGTPSPTLDCPGTQGLDLPASGTDSAVLDLGDPRVVALAAASDAGFADAGEALQAGIPVVVGFQATSPAHTLPDGGPGGADGGPDQIVRGFTVVDLHDDSTPANRNPEIDAVQIGDAGVAIAPDGTTSVRAGTVQRLTPVPAAGAKEQTPSGPEALGYSFFATAGDLSSLRSTDTTAAGQRADTFVDWTAPDAGGPVQIWVVVRDGRGGTAWLERDVKVLP